MPPFIRGFKTFLGDLSTWMFFLVPAVLVVIIIATGFSMYSKNDPHEVKEAKQKGIRAAIITGIIGSSTWLANYVWGLFS